MSSTDMLYDEVTQLRAKLRQMEVQWQATFDEAAIGMVHMALDRQWVRVNQHFCSMLGYTADELLAKTIPEITYPDDWRADITGMQQLITGECQNYITTKRYFHRNGTIIWGKLTLRVARTSEGLPDYFVAVIEDVTALKHTEDALSASEERYRHIIEDQVDLICRFGPDLCIIFANEAYAKLYGKSPEELVGQNLLDAVSPEYRVEVLDFLFSLTSEQPVAVAENPARLPDGSERWFHWQNRRIELPDGKFEYQGVGRDITDRKLAEMAEQEQRHLAEALRDSVAALTNSLDLKEVIMQILASVAKVVRNNASRVVLLDKVDGRTAYMIGYSPEAEDCFKELDFVPFCTNDSTVFDDKQSYFITDTQQEPNWIRHSSIQWIRSSMGVPITIKGEFAGLLIVDNTTPNYYKATDFEKLQAFAHYASLALTNAYQATWLEQRVAERTVELSVSEAKFRNLFHTAPIPIVIFNQLGNITLVNQQAEAFWGHQGADLLHQSIEVILPELVREAHIHNRIDYTDHMHIREMGSEQELFAQRSDGSKVPVEIQFSYIESMDGPLVMSFIIDITERKRAAEALRHQRDFLQEVIDHVPGIIVVQDSDGRYRLVNRYIAEKLATTPSMMLGKLFEEINPTHVEINPMCCGMEKVLHDKQALFVPELALGEHYYQASLVPLVDLANVDTQVLIVGNDITQRKHSETALEKALQIERDLNELKGQLITKVSHEFRTPLAVILSITETLRTYRHKLADTQIEDRLNRVYSQVRHLTQIIGDVADVARMQHRSVSFTPVETDPVRFFSQAITEFQDYLGSTRRLFYTHDAHIPLTKLDERLLRQILNNLLSNAVKYSASDQPIK